MELGINYFNKVLKKLENDYEIKETELYNKNSYEILVKDNSMFIIPLRRRIEDLKDSIIKFCFSIGFTGYTFCKFLQSS
jgi:formyltetrahydrofolate synthetase